MTSTKGLKLIGKGAFTKAFLNVDNSVILVSCCPIKECMSNGWFPDSELFPKLERVDSDVYSTYTMEYYPRLKGGLKANLDADQYAIYKTLRDLDGICTANPFNRFDALYKAFEGIECDDLQEVMLEALEACSNYGSDIGFEISPRNVAVKNGKLILLDCFYHIGTLTKVRKGTL